MSECVLAEGWRLLPLDRDDQVLQASKYFYEVLQVHWITANIDYSCVADMIQYQSFQCKVLFIASSFRECSYCSCQEQSRSPGMDANDLKGQSKSQSRCVWSQ